MNFKKRRRLQNAINGTGNIRGLRGVIDDAISKAGGYNRYIKLLKASDEEFINAIKIRVNMEPKETKTESDIRILIDMPRPQGEHIPLPLTERPEAIEATFEETEDNGETDTV